MVAKEGYAVGAITARTTTGIEGMSITFMRVNGARLNPNDAYESEWLAGTRGSEPTPMSGNGARVVGIRARENRERLSAVGLVFEGK